MAVFRKNGTCWIDYYYQDKRYRQKIGTRKDNAVTALAGIKVKIATGDFVPPDERKLDEAFERKPVLFEDFAQEEWIPWSETEHSRNHHSQQKMIIKAHLVPYLGGKPLHEITSRRVEDYRGKRAREAKKTTVNNEVSCLRTIFRKAVEWGHIEDNPAGSIKAFKTTQKTPRLLEEEEVATLLAKCREVTAPVNLTAFISCIAYAGLRKAEVLNLRWDGIDYKREELTVQSRPEWHTKNYESRTIPMNEELTKALKRTKEDALRRGGKALRSPLIFPTPDGTAYKNTHYIKAALDKAATLAEINDGVTFHQIRHSFCSHAQMQGVPPRTVQRWMGHRDLRTTLRYSHTSADHEKAAMGQLRYSTRLDVGVRDVR